MLSLPLLDSFSLLEGTINKTMVSLKPICTLLLLLFFLSNTSDSVKIAEVSTKRVCKFPAIYNFGDSNSDTGARSAAIEQLFSPNGETFFGMPSGRFCNGRLIIDFIAQKLKLPFLGAYLDSIGTNFRHGANFAAGGASILPGGYSPFHLGIQISQFLQFKSRTTKLYYKLQTMLEKNELIHNNTDTDISDTNSLLFLKSNLPRPQEFEKALYIFDIGQNDLASGFQHTSESETLASIPKILDGFSEAVLQLYESGARIFWVHNTGPIGCLPYNVISYEPKPHHLDKYGCVEPHNKVAREFNSQLKQRVIQLKAQLPGTAFTFVDIYSAKYSVIRNSKHLGFENPSKFCCGSYYGYHIECGKKAVVVKGKVYGNPCPNPSKFISWDGIHYSEAANLLVSDLILNGSLSYPSNVSIREACPG